MYYILVFIARMGGAPGYLSDLLNNSFRTILDSLDLMLTKISLHIRELLLRGDKAFVHFVTKL